MLIEITKTCAVDPAIIKGINLVGTRNLWLYISEDRFRDKSSIYIDLGENITEEEAMAIYSKILKNIRNYEDSLHIKI